MTRKREPIKEAAACAQPSRKSPSFTRGGTLTAARSHGSPGTAHASRLSFELLLTAECEPSHPALHFLFMNSLTTLDDLWMGRPRPIAVGLLESDGHRAIVV